MYRVWPLLEAIQSTRRSWKMRRSFCSLNRVSLAVLMLVCVANAGAQVSSNRKENVMRAFLSMFAGSCPGVSLPGAWYAEPIVTIPEYGSHLGVNVQFRFGSDGSYSYQALQGGLEWTRHSGRYRLAPTDSAGRSQGY